MVSFHSVRAGWSADEADGLVGRRWTARVRFALALVLLLGGLHFVAPPGVAAGQAATVDADGLLLRSDPGIEAPVLASMSWGDRVDVLYGPHAGGWYQIRHRGIDGWAYGDYLILDGAGSQSSTWGTAWVTVAALNVRAAADTGAGVLAVVTHGQTVSVTGGEVNGFVQIDYYGTPGWVWSGYLSYGAAPGPERWIDVNRSTGMVTLYVGNEAIASYWGALGYDQSDDGFFATANGTYWVYSKWADLAWTDWGQVYIRDWVAFDPYRQNGFHTYSLDEYGNVLPWGAAPTGGCVALEPWAARQVFEFAEIGTRVEVHW